MNRNLFNPLLRYLLRNSCASDSSLTLGPKPKLSLPDESMRCILFASLHQVLPDALKAPKVGSFCPMSPRRGLGIASGFLLSLTLFSLKSELPTCPRTWDLAGCSRNFSYSYPARHSSSSITSWKARECNAGRTNLSQGMRVIVTLNGLFPFSHIRVLHSQLGWFTCAERPQSTRRAVVVTKNVQQVAQMWNPLDRLRRFVCLKGPERKAVCYITTVIRGSGDRWA
jgi:hypothetical protein